MTHTMTGRERIVEAFALAKAHGRGALIPYLCAGDPNRATSIALLAAVAAAGADVLEVGIPYGDPLADGPTVAAAAQRAIDAGMTTAGALDVMKTAARAGGPPSIAFTYFNPVLQYGLEKFADMLVEAGACGAIVPDIPLEESQRLREVFAPRGLALPLLIAPTTPTERAREIARSSEGFIYVVSRLGVTSATKEPDFGWIAERIADLRTVTGLPIAIGFGISRADHVRRAWEVADGAIVGSALIDSYAGRDGDAAVDAAASFIRGLQP
jgi:tryptophan synthase alpha chain